MLQFVFVGSLQAPHHDEMQPISDDQQDRRVATMPLCSADLTELVDREAERGPGSDHRCSAVRSVKELEQARHKLVLVLVMSQTTVATEPPREYSILPINDHLQATTTTHDGFVRRHGTMFFICSEPTVINDSEVQSLLIISNYLKIMIKYIMKSEVKKPT